MNICLVSDFFHPKIGGVETHINALAMRLSDRGHRITILTHAYPERQGIRYLNNGVKIYYCPIQPFHDSVILFTVVNTLPLVRSILIREQIHIVHSHSSTSYFGNEILLHAQLMGFKTIYTDHSLFAFNDLASFHVNKILKFILSDINHCISVSHISKENLALRASLDPKNISVIPNAIDCCKFQPDPKMRYPLNTINIVVISRLAYRKGVDLLIEIIPQICSQFNQVHFIIGGDGPKRKAIENMIQKYSLENRVEMLGAVPPHKVRDILVRGHIFLNTSLTEAFCIAIVEAASCGLLVVSTNVGGIIEVLPKELAKFSDANSRDLIENMKLAILESKNIDAYSIHEKVKGMYDWGQVAERTENIYKRVLQEDNISLIEKIKKTMSNGVWHSLFILIILVIDYFGILLLDWRDRVDKKNIKQM